MPATRDTAAPHDKALEALRAALYPDEIIAALQDLRLEVKDIAAGVGTDERTVRRWLSGDSEPSRTSETALGILRVVVLYILQRRGFPPERVAQWLRMPNVELSFETPLVEISAGRKAEVVAAADAAVVPTRRKALPAREQDTSDAGRIATASAH